MAPSGDRTRTAEDNAATFLMTNMASHPAILVNKPAILIM
ncbi:hypothetical protein [Nostoc sp. PCC 7120 = FACHB-418]|nr:hypothetical protein [Nostoc sp. PCC 7120 = FACHB-418]